DFAFEYAKLEAVEYGVENAPTAQQIEDAQKTGTELDLPTGTIARAAALDVVYNTMTTAARSEITLLRQDPANRLLPAEDFANKVNAVINGYATTLADLKPSVGAKFKAAMSVEGNTSLRAHLAEAVKLQTEQDRATQFATAQSIIESIPEIMTAGASVGEDGTVRTVFDQFATKQADIMGLHLLTGTERNGFLTKFSEAADEAISAQVVDWMMADPTHSQQFLTGEIDDPNIKLIYEALDDVERINMMVKSGKAAADLEEASIALGEAKEKKRNYQAGETGRLAHVAHLNGDTEEFEKQMALLKQIDPDKFVSIMDATVYQQTKTVPDVLAALQRLHFSGRLTQQDILDNAEFLSQADQKSLYDAITSQRDDDYKIALAMAREKFAVPDGFVLNPAEDKTKKLTAFTSQLLLAIKKDAGLDRVQWAQEYLDKQTRTVSQITNDLLVEAENLKRLGKIDGEPTIESLKNYVATDDAGQRLKDLVKDLIDELEAAQK
ncbi:MAG: hypothetical protein VX978_02015, partial [Pseudomonadota bacterium]|nr:hypothetical protein [Pseudomonadota bacterium]